MIGDLPIVQAVLVTDIAPNVAPSFEGQHWINTTTKDVYFSVGTSLVGDWVLASSGVKSYATLANFPVEGTPGILYLAIDTQNLYLWDGAAYVSIENITDAQAALLIGGGDTTLHYHDSDRARANHTGTQLSTTISDFQTAVESNAQVSANSAHRALVTGNPHAVTKAEVGLGNAENTADLDKVISTATQTALDLKEDAFAKNTAFNKNFGVLAGTVAEGNHNHSGVYEPANANIQAHIIDTSNPHSVTKIQVGLGNVDDVSDLNKPISTATQTALDLKADITYVDSEILSAISSAYKYISDYNPNTNTPDLTTSPNSIKTGNLYIVSAAGTFFGENVEIGDQLIAKQDDPSLVSHWSIIQTNLDAASIKTQYESNADTNAYTDAEKTIVGNVTSNLALKVDKATLTTRGDLFYRNATEVTRLGLGAINTVLKSDGTDLNYGLISNSNIDASAGISLSKLESIGAFSLVGKPSAGAGVPEQVGVDGGLEFSGNNLRRAALTGDMTAPAGSNTTTLATAISDAIAANTAKVSADGSIGTHSDVDLTGIANNKILKYNSTNSRFEIADDGGISDHTLLSNIGTNTHDQIDTHIASNSNPHAVTKTQVGLSNVLNVAQEPAITAGTTAQYFRGDKTFQTLNTSVVPEGTNLYYTEAKVSANASVALNTTHRGLTNNPHSVTANQVGAYTTGETDTLLNAKVTGPASATDNAIAIFNGTTGKVVKNSTLFFGTDSLGINAAPPASTRLHIDGAGLATSDKIINILDSTGEGLFKVYNVPETLFSKKVEIGPPILGPNLTNSFSIRAGTPGIHLEIARTGASGAAANFFGGSIYSIDNSIGTRAGNIGIVGDMSPSFTHMYFSAMNTASPWAVYNFIIRPDKSTYFAGDTSVGVAVATARLHVKGAGTTSATYALKVENSAATQLLQVRDDGMLSVGGAAFSSGINVNNTTAAAITPSTLAYKTASIGYVSTTGGWLGSGFVFSNSVSGTGVFSLVYNNDTAYFGIISDASTSNSRFTISTTGATFGKGSWAATARVHCRGEDSTSANFAFKAEDTSGGGILKARNDGCVLMESLPTSSAGLPTGSLWNNAGVINII